MKNRRKSAKKIAEIAQPGDRVSLREMISGFGVAKGSVHFSRTHHFLMPALNIRFPRVVCAPFSQIQRLAHSAHAHHDDRAHSAHDAANRSGMRDLPVLEACEADMRPKSRGPKPICVQVLNFRVQSATHEHAKRRRAANNPSLHLRRFNPASLSNSPFHAFAPFLPDFRAPGLIWPLLYYLLPPPSTARGLSAVHRGSGANPTPKEPACALPPNGRALDCRGDRNRLK